MIFSVRNRIIVLKIFLLIIISPSTVSFAEQDSIITKGIWLPSIGEINVLFIFVQFPDDMLDTANMIWPKGKEPLNMNKWVDEKWSTNPAEGNITHYFNEMSLNKLKFTGKSISVISPHSRKWYLQNKKQRGFIHKEVILEANKQLDFGLFDNWSLIDQYKHIHKPDGIIDMIFMVWRNISNDYPSDSIKIIQSKLDFNNDEGDLGGAPFTVDNAKRTVKTGWGISGKEPAGSGVTIRNYISTNALRTCIHEFAHYLLGNNSYHSGYGFWGMLDAWGKRTQSANSFERSTLGWIDIRSIKNSSPLTLKDVKLRDFVTTGDALRITIDSSTEQFFYIENHQKKSYWENNHTFGYIEKGIYIIRQDNQYGQGLHLIPADGRYDWTVDQEIKNPWGEGMLPVYKQLKADRKFGMNDLEYLPWKWENKNMKPQPIHFTEDGKTSLPVKDLRFNGEKDAFNMAYNEVFSPWSNPDSQDKNHDSTGIGFKLNNEEDDGIYSLNVYIHTASEAPPSKPINLEAERNHNSVLISWTENIEPDMSGGYYNIYKADSENDFPGDFKLIKKLNASEKDHKTNTEWNDLSIVRNKRYFYRITAVDSDGLESVPSEYYLIDN